MTPRVLRAALAFLVCFAACADDDGLAVRRAASDALAVVFGAREPIGAARDLPHGE